jgi:hypothetical protein
MKTPKIPNTLVGCAGEHYVAYRLSAMGYHAALTRGGVPCVDVVVGSPEGHNSITIQVKTSNKAFFRMGKKHPDRDPACWCWPIGRKADSLCGETFFYAFVDLKGCASKQPPSLMLVPDVFVVPAKNLAKMTSEALQNGLGRNERTSWVNVWGKQQMYFFHIEAFETDEGRKEKERKWQEAWHLIERALRVSK